MSQTGVSQKLYIKININVPGQITILAWSSRYSFAENKQRKVYYIQTCICTVHGQKCNYAVHLTEEIRFNLRLYAIKILELRVQCLKLLIRYYLALPFCMRTTTVLLIYLIRLILNSFQLSVYRCCMFITCKVTRSINLYRITITCSRTKSCPFYIKLWKSGPFNFKGEFFVWCRRIFNWIKNSII